MSEGALTIEDVTRIDLLEGLARQLEGIADNEADGDRYLAYRRVSVQVELAALDLKQALIWRVGSGQARPAPMPRYTDGRRVYRNFEEAHR
jgi:hypothetical protein